MLWRGKSPSAPGHQLLLSQGRGRCGPWGNCSHCVNNEPGVINMDLSDYQYTAPVSITQEDGALIRAASTPATAASGARYYTGTITIGGKATSAASDLEYYTMSDFFPVGACRET